MGLETDLGKFLEKSHLSREQWDASDLNWDELMAIGYHHESRLVALNDSAEFIARSLRACNKVHSVRWRVKDSEHLMAKLVRKKSEKAEKYQDISVQNYHEKVTDLIGVRVLHLFKGDWEHIDRFINSNWSATEGTVAFVREGDERTVYEEKGCEVRRHDYGYRSIHYIIESSPTKERVLCEIQVRTLFEEAWSEIDHQVRYPNFSDNQVLAYFLKVFNRMAGSADEMGSFVDHLARHLNESDEKLSLEVAKNESHIQRIEKLVQELEAEKNISNESKQKLKDLSTELNQLNPYRSLTKTMKQVDSMGLAQLSAVGLAGTSKYMDLLTASNATSRAMLSLSGGVDMKIKDALESLRGFQKSNDSKID
ncbi:MAG: RelA/SpoT domain-containing protein [Thiomicrospira sp.]